MKPIRRWLAGLLCTVLLAGVLPTAAWASGDNINQSTEVGEGGTGTTTTETLSDTDPVTRAEMARMVYEHESLKTSIDTMAAGGQTPNFEDIIDLSENEVTRAQYEAIVALCKANLINGTSETTFSPTETVTRNEFAVVLWRATGCRSNNTAMTQTLTNVAYWAEAAVNCFFGAGLVKGDTSSDFRGNTPITVAEVDSFLTAYHNKKQKIVSSDVPQQTLPVAVIQSAHPAGSRSGIHLITAACIIFHSLLHLIDGTDNSRYTGPPDVAAFSAAPEFPSVFHGYFDVCHGIGVRTGTDAVFMECAD